MIHTPNAVAFLPEPVHQLRPCLDLVWRDELEAQAVEQGRQQCRLGKGRGGGVPIASLMLELAWGQMAATMTKPSMDAPFGTIVSATLLIDIS